MSTQVCEQYYGKRKSLSQVQSLELYKRPREERENAEKSHGIYVRYTVSLCAHLTPLCSSDIPSQDIPSPGISLPCAVSSRGLRRVIG